MSLFNKDFDIRTSTTLDDQLNDISVNVKSFGAKGDGITNDTTSIQNALNSLSVNGGGIFIPKGTYIISSVLNVPKNVSIKGAGINKTFIYWDENDRTTTTNSTMFFFIRNDSNGWSIISDLTMNQKRAERGLAEQMVYGGIVAADRMSVERVRIINTIGPGITEAGIDSIRIRDCEIYNTGHHCIYFSTGNLKYVRNVEITNNYLGTGATIAGRTLDANQVKLRFETAGDVIENIDIRNNRMGAGWQNSSIFISTTSGGVSQLKNINIENNVINWNKETNTGMDNCIYVGSNSKGENISISKNNVYGTGLASTFGIRLLFDDSTTNNVTVNKNTFINVDTGINVMYGFISENYVSFITNGLTGTTGKAYRNTFESSNSSAIAISSAIFDLLENSITLSGGTSIGINMGNSTNLIVVRNKITGANIGINRPSKTLTGCVFNENIFSSCTTTYGSFTNSVSTLQNNIFEPSLTDTAVATANRPTPYYVGQRCFDTTLNKPIWCKTTSPIVWVDATGATV
jgi:hypothetical protein